MYIVCLGGRRRPGQAREEGQEYGVDGGWLCCAVMCRHGVLEDYPQWERWSRDLGCPHTAPEMAEQLSSALDLPLTSCFVCVCVCVYFTCTLGM